MGMTPKRVLMVAYHFPPLAGSSGVQRTLRFAQYLPQFGWEPIVLTVRPQAYETTSDDLLREIPTGTIVHRAFAFDAARHLSLFGRYPRWLALPDRWASWKISGVHAGNRLIDQYSPHAIWSTYPIATAHLIGGRLSRTTGLPWIADFRDPMAQEGYPPDPRTWHSFKQIEEFVFSQARLCTFTTGSAANRYLSRYPGMARVEVLENGYDHEAFAQAEQVVPTAAALNPGCVTLVHSGIVYPEERDPTALFEAIARFAKTDERVRRTLRIRFRAPVHEDLLRRLSDERGLSAMVEILPPIPYREALVEMLRADALLVLQAANSDEQIPAKIYEYLRAGRPILAFVSPVGETGRMLTKAGVQAIVPLDDASMILQTLQMFLDSPQHRAMPRAEAIAKASRFERCRQLAGYLDDLTVC